MKKALITGITGQDGSYLAEFLLSKDYEIHGLVRQASTISTERIEHLAIDPHDPETRIHLHYGDLTDSLNLVRLIRQIEPDEIYNLAAMSHVQVSFETPEYAAEVDALGTLRILEAVRILGFENKTRIYQASTSELYGLIQETPQTEKTPFYPRSPYGVAKLYAYWITVNYREAYNMYAVNGILFNHESPRRGNNFISRKITRAAARIVLGLQDRMYLGNMDAQRDWGHAKDYVEGMWLMLQQDQPQDYVLATGVTTKVRDFLVRTFKKLDIELEFEGEGLDEKAIVKANNSKYDLPVGKVVVEINERYFRPSEVDLLIGDSSRAQNEMNWKPKYQLDDLIKEMLDNDLHYFGLEKRIRELGDDLPSFHEQQIFTERNYRK